MSGAFLGVNIPMLLFSTILVVQLVPGSHWGDLLPGACAAAGALLIFLGVRQFFPGTSLWLPRGETLIRLFLIALVEELAKYCAVAPWRRLHPPGRAALRGFGFASAENLLFLFLSPGIFLRRIFLAGALHSTTALLYGRPWAYVRDRRNARSRPRAGARGEKTHPYQGPAPLLDSLILLAGTGLHFSYNLLVLGVDAYPPI
ncbi:hypothetical protein SAMN05920897_11952 [Alkalispirochaeta americana]|uniref:Protease prsW family protein n=1 Tax=Alkalispirochaeta americana TaxID=159291 RepID=A0A1N6WZV3_9SPIO|nr:hypothetical protein [Alkalispirochaeta americana]SIQ95551.1 hypothetical protein SAMN05920897_11952 [Alkalispirochaeta americana]